MADVSVKTESPEGHPPHVITVTVNTRPVVFQDRDVTGAQIKETAIEQGVPIQMDFALFELRGPGKLVPVGDSDAVKLHPRMEFRAVAPDDTSMGNL